MVELEELATIPLVVREAGSGSGRAVDQALRQAGFDPDRLQVIARLGSNEAVKQAVISGFGAAFLSSLSIRRELAHGELHVLSMGGMTVARRFWLATRRARTLSPAAQAFAGLLAEVYGEGVVAAG